MVKWLKPGIAENLKIKFNVKRIAIMGLLAVFLLSSTGCTRSVSYPGRATIPPVLWLPPATPTNQQPTVSLTSTPLVTLPPSVPTVSSTPTIAPSLDPTLNPPTFYYTQSGDTLAALSVRFGVPVQLITSSVPLPESSASLLSPLTLLVIPTVLAETGPGDNIIPDSEVVFSPSAVDFDIEDFVYHAGGYLNTYTEWRTDGNYTGAQIIRRVAIENSVNPRLLLAILEYQSHWVYGQPATLAQTDYPIGDVDYHKKGLYYQLSWAVSQMAIGYYGWRAGLVTELTFTDDSTVRIAPQLNAGTVALQYLFAQLYNQRDWGGVLYSPDGLPALHEQMFGNPWLRGQLVEPLYPPDLTQPEMSLPFKVGHTWSLTGGPHSAWGPDGALAAIDFAPSSADSGCVESSEWVTASASGKVVRSQNGVVVVDLDGDGREQTGWDIMYLHIATKDRVAVGTWLNADDNIGHPSCEGGSATGTHVHMARKYNGEWILADGPLPFTLSDWVVHAGDAPYKGYLSNNGAEVIASTVGSYESRITRTGD